MRLFPSLCIGLMATVGALAPLQAFELLPDGTSFERKLAGKDQKSPERLLATIAKFGVDKFGEGVHEEITNRSLGCDGDADICADPDWDPAMAYILAGVRWNDDPPFQFEKDFGKYPGCALGKTIRLVVYPECWARVFRDAAKRSKKEKLGAGNAPLLARSHYGDMQFLHAMAAADGESAALTQGRLMMWAEFTWKSATRKIQAGDLVAAQDIDAIKDVFAKNGWSLQDLFALGNPHIRKSEYLADVAFGSLLHTVQDSFSKAHVERAQPVADKKCAGAASSMAAPGQVVEFHSYANQDSALHKEADRRSAFSAHLSSDIPTVVDIGRLLVDQYRKNADWTAVRPYIACIFETIATPHAASAGNY